MATVYKQLFIDQFMRSCIFSGAKHIEVITTDDVKRNSLKGCGKEIVLPVNITDVSAIVERPIKSDVST